MNVAYDQINSSDAAKRIGVSIACIQRWCRDNIINYINVSDGTDKARYLLEEDEVTYIQDLVKKFGVRKAMLWYPSDEWFCANGEAKGEKEMNRDLSKFEPPKAEPDGLTKKLFGLPRITCAACGSINVKGYYNHRNKSWNISCPDCGVSIERPDIPEDTELENEVDILNSYEKLRYEVNKSKEEANA